MADQADLNYSRIAEAIRYIHVHFKNQPSLEEIAQASSLSPYHFQRLFTEWAGVSPKKFMQYVSIEYAKRLLKEQSSSLQDTAFETGLSGTGRLHDLFVTIQGMTPGEFKYGGEHLTINYCFTTSPFGKIIIASTTKGICHMSFIKNESDALDKLKQCFPNAQYHQTTDQFQQGALSIFKNNGQQLKQIKLHLKCSDFQLNVWKALLTIPTGQLATYGNIAEKINKPKASRAVGTAIANNPVGYIIPCHRVIQASGKLGGYMWGSTRKSAIIGWEASRVNLGTEIPE